MIIIRKETEWISVWGLAEPHVAALHISHVERRPCSNITITTVFRATFGHLCLHSTAEFVTLILYFGLGLPFWTKPPSRPPSQTCLSIPAGGWRDEDMGWGQRGCRRRLCGAALSLRSLFCQPGATDQQSASQPCTDLIPLSLSISVSLYLTLPLCQRHLLSPCLLPTPTACPATNGACLSGNLPAFPFLSAALHGCLSISSSSSPLVCLLLCLCLCLCAWVPACPSACLPASHSF